MASRAELRAKVSLDASPFRRGLARVRFAAKNLARDVGPAMRQFSGAVANGAQAIIAAGAALGGAGVAKNFQLESLQVQFKTLLGSAAAARDRMAQLVDFAASTPFGLEDVARANKALEAAGQGNMQVTRAVGDAAAATGTNFVELAQIMQKAFAMNAAGVALGDVINQLNERALLSADAFAELRAESAKGISTPRSMKIIMGELAKFEGAMGDLSKTGAGTWSTLKDNIGLALAEITAGLADATKVGMQGLIDKIDELRKNGTLKDWGRQVAANIQAIIGAFRSLSDEQRAALGRMAATGAGFVAAWRAGLVQPLLSMTAAMAARIIALLNPKVLLAGLVAIPAFITGLAIGKTLEKHFNFSGLILKAAEFAKAMAKMMVVLAANIANPFLKLGGAIGEFFTTGQIGEDTADALLDAVNPAAVVDRLRNAGNDIGAAMRAAFAEIDAVAGDDQETGFFDDLLAQIESDFAAIPGKLRDLVTDLKEKLGEAVGVDATADALKTFAAEYKRLKAEHLDKKADDPLQEVGKGAAGAAAAVAKLKNMLAGFRGGLIRDAAVGATTPGMRAAAAARATPGAGVLAGIKNRLAGGQGRPALAAPNIRPAMAQSTDRMAAKLLSVAQVGVKHLQSIDGKGVIMGWA